jgi:hypothetical protein
MKFKLPLAAAAALFLGVVGPAAAGDETPLGTIGHWQMTAKDGFCQARGAYKNGTHLSFVINDKGVAMISIENDNWHIPKGSYPVEVQVDRAGRDTATATADDGWIVFEFALNEPTINLLSYGRTMFVTVGRDRYQYDLVRSELMLKALSSCATGRMASANPFAGTAPQASAPPSTNPFPETASNPYRRM